jgi:AraC-like DNA-binding protein
MVIRTYTPRPPLSNFVELFWYFENEQLPHEIERVLPTGTMELVIDLRQDKIRSSLVCGAHSEYFVIDRVDQAAVMGVHFKPGGGFPFFGVPADEMQNARVSLDALWGSQADELRGQLLDAKTEESRVRILERTLWARIRRPLAQHRGVTFALAEFQREPAQRISDVTRQIGLSARQFIRIFSEEVGLTPKQFCRIQRFQQVLRRVHNRREVQWVDVALACGYFDQAHFIHDFRLYSGLSPTVYLTQRDERLNHVPIRD